MSKLVLTRSNMLRAAALAIAVVPGIARAAVDTTWNGGGADNLWTTKGNWVANAVPDGFAAFNNDAAGANNKTTVTVGGPVTIGIIKWELATAAGYTIGNAVGDGTITLTGTVPISMLGPVATNQTINSNLLLGGTGQTFTSSSSTSSVTMNGTLGGGNVAASNLTLNGTGVGIINGAITNNNSASLGVTIGAGSWTLGSSASTFSGPSATVDSVAYTRSVLHSGGTLGIGASSVLDNDSNLVSGPLGTGTLIINAANVVVQAVGGDQSVANTVVNNNVGWTVSGSNKLTLSGLFVVGGGATLTNNIDTTKSLTISGNVHIRDSNSATGRTQTFAGSGTTIISGNVSNGTDTTVGFNGGLTNAGTGTLKLSGSNSYTGTTTVNSGSVVLVNGTHTPLTVAALSTGGAYSVTGTLGGTGTISPAGTNAVTINAAGTLAPGDSLLATAAQTGTLDIGNVANNANKLVFAASSNFAVQIGGTTVGDGAGSYDQVNVTSTASAVTVGSTVNLTLALVNGFVPSTGSNFFILNRADAGAYSTLFNGTTEGGGVTFTDGSTGNITYKASWNFGTQTGVRDGLGNDVAIYNIVAVPEPASVGLLAVGAGLLLRRRRSVA